jgi:hypothetical protein
VCDHRVYKERYELTERRLGRQRGPKVAQVELSRKLTEAIWHMLTRSQPFALTGVPNFPAEIRSQSQWSSRSLLRRFKRGRLPNRLSRSVLMSSKWVARASLWAYCARTVQKCGTNGMPELQSNPFSGLT